MQFKYFALFLATGGTVAAEIGAGKLESSSGCQSTAVSTAESSFAAGGLSQSAEATRASPVSLPPAPETTTWTQKCAILTLITSIKQSSTSTPSISDKVLSTLCFTITSDHSESQTPSDSSLTANKIPMSSKTASVISYPSAEAITGSNRVSALAPCLTDITITKTIVETWLSSEPFTTALVHTQPVTITSVIVETYSTSTGGRLVPATRTTAATINQISIDTECPQAKGCCSACGVVESSQPVSDTLVLLESSITESDDPQGAATVSAAKTGMSATESETGNPSVSTAGAAAAATAGIGLGALVGLLVVLA